MSGGNITHDDDSASYASEVEDTLQQLDQEMKEDTATVSSSGGSSVNATMRRGSATETTWNFVQMNMTLLPIARPLPVSISNRIQDGLTGRKPRTPTQKLHDRILRNASNISPRHIEDSMSRRRGSASSETGTAACIIPRMAIVERQSSAPSSVTGKRKAERDDHYLSPPWKSSSVFHPVNAKEEDDESRSRSFSEELAMQSGDSIDSQLESFVLGRSASASSAFSQRGSLFKDRRILEIQDEERRLQPDERARSLPSPSKRSRHK